MRAVLAALAVASAVACCRGDAGCDRCQGTGLHPIAPDLLGEEARS